MNLLELIFAGFMIYLLYKLVFGLILPVSRAASQMKGKMADFQRAQQDAMQQQHYQQQQPPPQNQRPPVKQAPTATTKPSKDDYLDFEEVK